MKKKYLVIILLIIGSSGCTNVSSSTTSSPTVAPIASSAPPSSPSSLISPSSMESKITVPETAQLIPSTDSKIRRAQIFKGSLDPFVLFPVQETIQLRETQNRLNNKKFDLKKLVLSPPVLAQATSILGVIFLGDDNIKIILKAPREKSALVKVGDFICKGQVLVKEVISANSTSPIVVLQENGQKVLKGVGQENINL